MIWFLIAALCFLSARWCDVKLRRYRRDQKAFQRAVALLEEFNRKYPGVLLVTPKPTTHVTGDSDEEIVENLLREVGQP